jgi:FtsH-binding integral membrane protein
MSDLDRNYPSPFGRAAGRIDAATVDAGLRAYMLRIYNYMSIGLAITGLAALGVYMAAVTADPSGAAVHVGSMYLTPFGYAIFVSPLKWLFILAPLAMVFAISAGINRLRPAAAQMLFWVFSALMGISLSSIFLVYTHTSIVRVFFITAATFGALSLYGYTTKRDMTGIGSFLIMGLFGIVIASVVNLFLGSSMLQFMVSVIGVLVFAGLTAYDTQRLKNDYIYGYASQGGDVAERASIIGALSLYLNFINLFTLLLQLLGQRD